MELVLVSHDPSWKESFSEESEKLSRALGQNVIAIHHIGSTSIPDILAKPVIDVLIEVAQIDQVDVHASQMSDLGYESMGEYGIVGRRYFRRSAFDKCPAFHVHVFKASSEPVTRHLAFREYLRANPSKAREYSDLKAALSTSRLSSRAEYQEAKAPFIETCIEEATELPRD